MPSLRLTFLSSILLFSLIGNAQIFSSSCTAPQAVVNSYQDDADRLVLERSINLSLPEADSVQILNVSSDTVMRALLSVYNLTGTMPAADTVVTMFDIHSFGNPPMKEFFFSADSTLPWMQQLSAGNLSTGEPTLDGIISALNVSLISYNPSGISGTAYVLMETDSNYNLEAFVDDIDALSGVQYCITNIWGGGGPDITAQINSDHVELTYSYGWGDCPSGCMNKRYWVIKAYYDCTDEFMGSSGSILTPGLGVGDSEISIAVYPNPCDDYIVVSGPASGYSFQITNMLGQVIKEGTELNTGQIPTSFLSPGVYSLSIESEGRKGVSKFIKQ